jgi:YgiT-type zinc finger domain-containing protein
MICKHGETKDGFTTVTLEKNGATLIFKNVPALVCDNCGEKYLADSISKELLFKAKEILKSGVEIDIRDYQKVA